MPRPANNTIPPPPRAPHREQTRQLLEMLRDAPDEMHAALLAHMRRGDPETLGDLVEALLGQHREAQQALAQADRAIAEQQQVIDGLTRPPLLEAGVLAVHGDGTFLVSLGGGSRQEVTAHPDLPADALRVGDTVALAQDGHVIVKRLDADPRGRVATVRGWQGAMLLVEYQPEYTLAVTAAEAVAEAAPSEGDRVLVHESWQVALEVLERREEDDGDGFDPVVPDQVGGLDDELDEILLAVQGRFLEPERAGELGLESLGGLILEGPPGTGKTLLARALATALTEHHGMRVRFINVAPGSWRDPYYGVSDHKVVEPIDRAERMLAEGLADLVILFYDELDTLGSRSAEITSRIDSRVLSALLHRMDGVAQRAGRRQLLFVGATNRTDLLDEALLRPGRFGGLVVRVPRPGRETARAIFRCHLHHSVRFRCNGDGAGPAEMVERCADAALARLFADADPADALAELVLAGGQRRPVYGREIVSGAMIASLVQRAKRHALKRGLVGPPGLVPEDFAQAADEELDTVAARLVDPFKVREILDDRTLSVAHGVPRRRARGDVSGLTRTRLTP
jgi:proteasome-associated ATPase